MKKKPMGSSKVLPCGRPAPENDHGSPKDASGQIAPPADWKTRLDAFLEEQELRSSDQRWKIAEIVLSQPGHHSAQELIQIVRKKFPEIGPATVYRNLKVLCDAGLLQEWFVDDLKVAVYEIATFGDDHHDHLVCLDCGAIFEFHEERIESIQREVAKSFDFKEAGHRHIVYAHCQKLAKGSK
jgi:Fur family ferric uptake transcriptional regulator